MVEISYARASRNSQALNSHLQNYKLQKVYVKSQQITTTILKHLSAETNMAAWKEGREKYILWKIGGINDTQAYIVS